MEERSERRYVNWEGETDPCTVYTAGGKQYELRYIVKVKDSAMREQLDTYSGTSYPVPSTPHYIMRCENGGEMLLVKEKSWITGHTKMHGEYKLFRWMLKRPLYDSPTPLSASESASSPYLAYVRKRS